MERRILVTIDISPFFFLILQIAHGGKIIRFTLLDDKKSMLAQDIIVGIFQISMRMLFFTVKPYKKVWMSIADGIIFTLIGCYFLIEIDNNKQLKLFVIA